MNELNSKQYLICDCLKDYNFHKHCHPLFIGDYFALDLMFEECLRPTENSKNDEKFTRNGTISFIEINDKVYGITAGHVVDILNKKSHENVEHYNKLIGNGNNMSEFQKCQKYLFYLLCGSRFIPINSTFIKLPSKDPFTTTAPDMAIARIESDYLKSINREPFKITINNNLWDKIYNKKDVVPYGLAGYANGYPELSRNIEDRKLGILGITAFAEIEISSGTFVLKDELKNIPKNVNDLSGMSGGPIFWSNKDTWGFAGIVQKGRPLNKANDSFYSENPGIWIRGEMLPEMSELIKFVSTIPEPSTEESRNICIYDPRK